MITAPPNTSNDANDFFQSDLDLQNQQRRLARKDRYGAAGDPIVVSSKVLALLIPDASEDDGEAGEEDGGLVAYVGESGHVARRLDLLSGKSKGLYKGHTGPVTCLAVMSGRNATGEKEEYLFTGSWDKTIRKWNAKTRDSLMTFTGHSDFIKCLKIHTQILLSGSSDATLRSWDTSTGKTLSVCKGIHKRAVESITIDPDQGHVYSGSSDTTVRRWSLRGEKVEGGETVATHLTSVYGVTVCDEDLWSVSADKTAKRWSLLTGKCDMTLEHPDFVKCVTVIGPYVVTGGRDENIRVWDIASGKCLNTIEAHFGEVSTMAVANLKLWTGSLDGTIRRWDFKDLATYRYVPPETDTDVPDPTAVGLAEATSKLVVGTAAPAKVSVMTEDEERELAELMDD
ncbi:hypothetical protein HDU67_007179 [Dinochytrium kinnereticum]|nr:hypothetical protein HDU67_007179 [Dinochytrium kinnereticum]